MDTEDVTIKVRTADLTVLDQLAEHDWRGRAQQASAMLESALATARARANPTDRTPRSAPRRTPAQRTNGVARVEA